MKTTNTGGLFFAVILAASLVTTPLVTLAQDKPKEPEAPAATDAKQPRPYPFSGKVSAVDKEKKTITLLGKEKSRTLHLDGNTKIMKNDKAATLDETVVGDEVAGQLRKTDDGKEILVSFRIGPKPPAAAKTDKEK